MKRIAVIICYVSLLAMLAACDSTTGRIIDDYNRSKHPIARVSALPDAVTADKEADITVGGKDITAYRYRLNNSAWSIEYQVDIVLVLKNIDPGKQKLEVIGTINGRDWQAQNQATAYSWEVVPDWNCLKDIRLNKGSLCPVFNPYSKEKQEYTVLLNEQDARIDLTPLTYDVNAVVAYREYTEGTAAGTFTETVDPIVSTLAVDETRIFEIRVSSDRAADDMVYTVTVTRESRKWSEPVTFAEGQQSRMVVDNDGVVTIIYTIGGQDTSDDSHNDLWAVTYTEGNGFSTPQKIGTNDDGYIILPNVCIDKYGNILVAWFATDVIEGTYHSDVWANRYIKGLGWQRAQLIEEEPDSLLYLNVNCDADGNGIVSWVYTKPKYRLYVRHFNIKNGWEEPVKLEDASTEPDYVYMAGVILNYDYSGNAFLAWIQSVNGIKYYYVKKYTKNNGWEQKALIKSLKTNGNGPLYMAFDRFGNGFLYWNYSDGKKYHNFATRYTPAGGWGNTETLGNGTYGKIAFDSAGNALIAWYGGDVDNYLYLSKYSYHEGWQNSVLLKANSNQNLGCMNLYCDQSDNFIIVQQQYDKPDYKNIVLKISNYSFSSGLTGEYQLFTDANSNNTNSIKGSDITESDQKLYYVFDHYTAGTYQSYFTIYSND